jgi:hypothetical protein
MRVRRWCCPTDDAHLLLFSINRTDAYCTVCKVWRSFKRLLLHDRGGMPVVPQGFEWPQVAGRR